VVRVHRGPLQFVWLSITRTRTFARSATVNVAAMGNSGDDYESLVIVHRIDDAVIANANTEVIPTSKLY
jgi:hypothetical protein